MRILLVHNSYGKPSGEECVVDETRRLLRAHGHVVEDFRRASSEIKDARFGELRAFCSGIYSTAMRREFGSLLRGKRPDIVHLNNLYPFISHSVIDEAFAQGVPTVMTLHNYRMLCPNGRLLSNGDICHRCAHGSEIWCVVRNCEGSIPKSIGYAARNFVARKSKVFDKVTLFIALTEFQERELTNRLPAEKMRVVPNPISLPEEGGMASTGSYVGFVGRLSREKGVSVLIDTARMNPDLEFRFAGDWTRMSAEMANAPKNCRFLGFLDRPELINFYSGARVIVVPSIWYEVFPLSLLEAMAHGKAVLCSHIGALPDIIEEDVSGFTFEPQSAQDLSNKLKWFWSRSDLIDKVGARARERVRRNFSDSLYYERLLGVYEEALGHTSDRELKPCRL